MVEKKREAWRSALIGCTQQLKHTKHERSHNPSELAGNFGGFLVGMYMEFFSALERYGLVGAGRKVLDLGSSNLYLATADEIKAFVRRHNPNPRDDLEAWAARMAAGAQPGADGQASNQSFVGEMLEAAGMEYDSIDIASGYKTTILDLNRKRLPDHMVGAYDAVLNFGTSEHILNQMNVFATVHAATKRGGMIMHNVPSVGWVDHGYFCYTSRFFFDLAGYNEYEVIDMWYDGPTFGENVFDSAHQYQSYFPALTKRLGRIGISEQETLQNATAIPRFTLAIVYRKHKDVPFMGAVEQSTSVGAIPEELLRSYQS
jgi:hypothetical protein